VAAFEGETDPALASLVEEVKWLRVGQLGKMISFIAASGARHAIMAGQIAPRNLFDLRPDVKALLILARLKERNAESIFRAIGEEMAKAGVDLLPATTFLDDQLARNGIIAGPRLSRREEMDLAYGFKLAKEVSRLDIGQTVVVKSGSVLAVEAFEGTNAAIARGGELGRKEAVMVKVSKPKQDLRFDVPVVGPLTLEAAHAARIRVIGVEAGRTLILEPEKVQSLANERRITLCGMLEEPES
jgi:UDP-2,3-diacylglucosamine hydrolase